MVGGVPSRRPTVHWPRDGDAASDHDEDRQEGPLEAESRTKDTTKGSGTKDTTKGSGTKGSTKGSGTKHTTKAHPSDMNSRAASSLERRDPQSATAEVSSPEVTSPEVTSPASGAPIPLEAPTLRHGVLEICQIADGRAALRHGLQDGGAYGVGWEARRVDLEWCELMCACVHVCTCARVHEWCELLCDTPGEPLPLIPLPLTPHPSPLTPHPSPLYPSPLTSHLSPPTPNP